MLKIHLCPGHHSYLIQHLRLRKILLPGPLILFTLTSQESHTSSRSLSSTMCLFQRFLFPLAQKVSICRAGRSVSISGMTVLTASRALAEPPAYQQIKGGLRGSNVWMFLMCLAAGRQNSAFLARLFKKSGKQVGKPDLCLLLSQWLMLSTCPVL